MNRLKQLWSNLRSGFWFTPSLIVVVSIVVAVALIEVDSAGMDRWLGRWPRLFGAGAEGARGMMSTIAGSMMTVVGVTFSMILVVLAPHELIRFVIDSRRRQAGTPALVDGESPDRRETYDAMNYLAIRAARLRTTEEYLRWHRQSHRPSTTSLVDLVDAAKFHNRSAEDLMRCFAIDGDWLNDSCVSAVIQFLLDRGDDPDVIARIIGSSAPEEGGAMLPPS